MLEYGLGFSVYLYPGSICSLLLLRTKGKRVDSSGSLVHRMHWENRFVNKSMNPNGGRTGEKQIRVKTCSSLILTLLIIYPPK